MTSPTHTHRSRRQVLKGSIAAGTALALWGNHPVRAQTPASTRELGGSLHILTADGINTVARTDDNGVILVDGGSASSSRNILDAASALTDNGPVHTLFNTHWHPEQTGSNLELGEAGATIIAQENTRLWLTTDITYPWDESQHFGPLPKIAQPNQSFYDDGELDSGIRYGYLRHAAHTDGDLYVYFPEENVLAVGDAVSGEGWPFVDWWTGGWIGGIVGGLELILSLMDENTRVVPARGPVLGLTDIQGQFEMYNEIYSSLTTLMNTGRGPDDAVAERPTEKFDDIMGPPDEFVRRSFESLGAYLSPDA